MEEGLHEEVDAGLRFRWIVLVCAALMPTGCHMCYKSTSGLEKDLIRHGFDPSINHAQYGLLNSAVSWVNLFLPFLVGVLLDIRSSRLIAVSAALVAVSGQVIFACGVEIQSFAIALAGRFVFGAAEGSMMMAQGTILSQWFHDGKLTFAFGVCTMTHNLSNWLGKIAVAIGKDFGNWRVTNWIGVAVTVLGVMFALGYAIIERKVESSCKLVHLGKHGKISCKGSRHLKETFWLLWFLHLLVSNVEHLFDTYSADFISSKWHTHTEKAAWLSSLNYVTAIVLSPLVGLFLDVTSCRMFVAGVSCAVMGVSHALLGLTKMNPGIGLVMLSLPESVLPTILKSCVPLIVPPSAVGLAFGVYEVAENLGKIIGAPLVGWIRDTTQSYTVDEEILIFASIGAAVFCVAISLADWYRCGALNAGPARRRLHCDSLRLIDTTELGELDD